FAEISRIDTKQAEIRRRSVAVQQFLDQAIQEAGRKQMIENRNAFIQSVSASRDWAEVLRSLSFVVPDTAVFDSVRIDQKGKAALVIQGSVEAESLDGAYAEFNHFFGTLKQ